MKKFNKEQKTIARQYIDKLLNKYNIKSSTTKPGNFSYAFPYNENKQPKIKIPKPINSYKLGVGLHEIGHIVLGHCKIKNNNFDKRPDYVHEYEAEQFAISKLKKLGFYTKEYEIEAIRYVLETIAKSYNKKHPLNKVPKKIIKWTGLKINTWKRAKKILVPRNQDVNSKRKIIIQCLFPGKEIYSLKFNK